MIKHIKIKKTREGHLGRFFFGQYA